MHLGILGGFSTFIPPSFPVTLTHAPFDKNLVKHSLKLGLLVTFIHFLRCCSAVSEHPQPRQSHPDVTDLALLSVRFHSPSGDICIPSPILRSFDIVEFYFD